MQRQRQFHLNKPNAAYSLELPLQNIHTCAVFAWGRGGCVLTFLQHAQHYKLYSRCHLRFHFISFCKLVVFCFLLLLPTCGLNCSSAIYRFVYAHLSCNLWAIIIISYGCATRKAVRHMCINQELDKSVNKIIAYISELYLQAKWHYISVLQNLISFNIA